MINNLFYNIRNFFIAKFNNNISLIIIFFILIVFEDGEIPRHRYPFDYLSFLFFLYFRKNSKKKS